jgi:hypothetical protein
MERSLLGFMFASAFVVVSAAQPASDREHIQHLLMATFDKPEGRLQVAPVAIVGDNSVAGWVQDDKGGRALLRKKQGKWTLILCSGDSLKDAKQLEQVGVSSADARALSSQLAEQEAQLSAGYVALLSTFEGIVMMDQSGNHPPHQAHPGRH